MLTALSPTSNEVFSYVDNSPETTRMVDLDSCVLLGQWADLMKANDLSEATIHTYLYAMWSLLAHVGFHLHVLEVTESHIAAFLASQGLRSTSKEQHAKGVRNFYTWAYRRGYLLTNPVAMIQPRRVQRPIPVRFEEEEVIRLLMAAAYRDPRRAWAILACLCLGTRRTEFVSIRLSDIDWNRAVVTLRYTKGRRPRTVDMSPWAVEAIRELLASSDGERLLPIQPNTLNQWVHDAVADAGLGHEVGGRHRTAHTLRATFVSTLLDDGVPPHVVGAIVGHQSLTTTSAYAAVGSRHTTKDAVQIFGPPVASSAAAV